MTKEPRSVTLEKRLIKKLEERRVEESREMLENGNKCGELPSFSEMVEDAAKMSPFLNKEVVDELKEKYKEFQENKLTKVPFSEFVRKWVERKVLGD